MTEFHFRQVPYIRYLCEANEQLQEAGTFFIYPGMEFGSREKWWPDTGERPSDHEGLDICYYYDRAGIEQSFTSEIRVPAMASGKIFTLCADFLGSTIFIEHNVNEKWRFLSAYAHIVPAPSLQAGAVLQAGDCIGSVVDTAGLKNRMPAHLHLSILKLSITVTAKQLNWNLICHSDRRELIDPCQVIDCRQMKMLPTNHWKENSMSGNNPISS